MDDLNGYGEIIQNGRGLYVGNSSFLEKNKVYDVMAYILEDFGSVDGSSICIKVLDPEKTLTYRSLEEYKADWAKPVEKRKRYCVDVHFTSGQSTTCDLISSLDYDKACQDGISFFETNVVASGNDIVRVNPHYVEWITIRACEE